MFEHLNKYRLRINLSKSTFRQQNVEILEYSITSKGFPPLPQKVQATLNYKTSQTIHELSTFLGMINFYRFYLKGPAKTQTILHDYLNG